MTQQQRTSLTYEQAQRTDVANLRRTIRTGDYRGRTRGLAPGKLQASVVVIPREVARAFHQFCLHNAKPCPLVGVGRVGSPLLPSLGDIDVRSDLPGYSVYREGKLVDRPFDVGRYWRDDLAVFALGSSYTFEHALIERNVALRHVAQNKVVPKFRSAVRTVRIGPFGGEVVVSLRPIRKKDLDTVRAVTARFPQAHGAPVHAGDPYAIGIQSLCRPDWGDPIDIRDDEVPVFWASGVTALNALVGARLDLCITHSPGRMLATDIDALSDIGAFKTY
jgi:uncharacterized protein YcsI (UPF0317 family)